MPGAVWKGLAGSAGVLAVYLFWFSYVRARAFYGYFGVAEAVGLQFRDEANAALSISSLFAPVIILLLVLIFVAALNGPITAMYESHPRRMRIVANVSFALGTVFMVALLLKIFVVPWQLRGAWLDMFSYFIGFVSLLLFSYGVYLRRRYVNQYQYRLNPSSAVRAVQGVALVVLLGVLALALTASYAVALGRAQAEQLSYSDSLQKVILYSKVDQQISGKGVSASRLSGDEEGGYRYRYSGLRLLAIRDSKLILLTDRDYSGFPTAIQVDDNEDIRVNITY